MSLAVEMAMEFDDIGLDLDFYGYGSAAAAITTMSTTTTTTTSDDEPAAFCNWNDWSPVVDWEALSGGRGSGGSDDFQDLIESMMDDSGFINESTARVSHDYETCNSVSTDATCAAPVDDLAETNCEDSKGLRLVHLLMAAAEALSGVNKSCELARVILVRLKELVSPNDGTNMERLAAYFTDALQGLLEGAGGAHSKHSNTNGPYHHQPRDDHHRTDVLAAFQLLQDMSPYVKFGHFTANQAILEAVAYVRRVHIVDYDIMEGVQWASLMQALVSRKDGPPAPHLRITALSRGNNGRRSIGTLQETGRRLMMFAQSIGLPFSFHQCRLDNDDTFRPSALKIVKGETVIFNCMLHMPHSNYRIPNSVASFLSVAKTLNSKLVTLVEEEVVPIREGEFVSQFMDLLHHYSAIFDSLEAGFPLQSRARALVERVFLGPRVSGTLARIYHTRGEDDGGSWSQWLAGVGYKPINISFANHCQSKLLLGLFNDGYKVEELANNKLVLGWKSRRLLSASIWTSSLDYNM